MISDNIFRDTKLENNLIEEKQCHLFTIIFKSRHGMRPLYKVVYGNYDVLVISYRKKITISKMNARLYERTDSDNREKWS